VSTTPTATVPFVDLERHHAPIANELEAAFRRVLGSSGFTLGAEVDGFEAEFADFCGVEHCVGVASGTAALTLALQAAGIGAGDEVILPAHTFIASALGVVHAGATPVFCDVEPDTGLLDPDATAAAVGPRTAAVLPVHLYGQVCDMRAIGDLARRHGLMVIEDAAQAHGARFEGARAGALGAAGCFSFYPSKNLGALGDGGAVSTNDPELARRVRQLRNLGQRAKGDHLEVGYNERLDGLQAALLRVKLPWLERWNDSRRERAAQYRGVLEDCVETLGERPGTPCVFHLFPIRVPDRDAFQAQLQEEGISVGLHYSPAVPDQPPWREKSASASGAQDWPAAREWAAQELSLPMFAELRADEVERVGEICRRIAGASDART
jgi:dTDP-4-amino-4,6-dideoxygalactose transaminase